MTWTRLLGPQSLNDAEARAGLFRAERPDLAERVANLLAEIEEAGINPLDWPYPRGGALAGQEMLRLSMLAGLHGPEALIANLEERWRRDRPSRPPQLTALPGGKRRRGRPRRYSAWDVMAARVALLDADLVDTQENVVELLGWDPKTVQGYWPDSEPRSRDLAAS